MGYVYNEWDNDPDINEIWPEQIFLGNMNPTEYIMNISNIFTLSNMQNGSNVFNIFNVSNISNIANVSMAHAPPPIIE